MATYSKQKLSQSTDGKAIQITSSGSAGNLIHTAHATDLDEIYLYGVNTSLTTVKVTIEWGMTGTVSDIIEVGIPGESGLYLIAPGLILTNGLPIRAFANYVNVVNVFGFVNRITA